MIQELREALNVKKKEPKKMHILGTVPKILKFGNIWKVQTLEFQLSLGGGGLR